MENRTGEFEYIDWIRQTAKQNPFLPIGIGDDTAMLALQNGRQTLLAADMLMEGVHFTLEAVTPRQIGRKALAVNLSDIAAMAGHPRAALVSVAFPQNAAGSLPRKVHKGIEELADQFDVVIAGGDTNSWNGPLVINVAVIGEPAEHGPVLRSGARVGDWIFVTDRLGGSLAGKHFSFTPRVEEALQLAECVDLHAMIDISDGLAADLHHILEESEVGAEIDSAKIPISEAAFSLNDSLSPLQHALQDGEDFELLFTVSEVDGKRLVQQSPLNVSLTQIGNITRETGCFLVEETGRKTDLPALGWKHSL
ncbi:MAG: thiamine-phosphate kinase [Planctomycetaceae bacterium]